VVKRATVALVALILVSAVPRLALAEEWIFFDPHPIHPAAGRGFCETAGAHVHDYAPVDPGAFVLQDGLWFFVGDPVAFGYRGTVYRFEGSHEVDGSEGGAVCGTSGVHYHLYAPTMFVGAGDVGAVYVTPVIAPHWWDHGRRDHGRWDHGARRHDARRRPHAFPVDPPPDVRRRPAIGPPAARARGSAAPMTPRRPAEPRGAVPPPPARAATHR
jgi:hypothetical protein